MQWNTSIKQRDRSVRQMKAFPDRLAYAATFSLEGWDEPDWQEETIAYLEATQTILKNSQSPGGYLQELT